MSLPFDATLKEIIGQNPEDFRGVFDLPPFETAIVLNLDLSTISAATDVALGFGDPLKQVVDLNFQSGPDPHLPARLLLYNAAFHFRYRVPVQSVAILLRPRAEVKNLDGKLAYQCEGRRIEFEYSVLRMWQQPVEPFFQGGLNLLPLATLCKVPDDRPQAESLREIVERIDRHLLRLPDHAQAVRLMTASFIFTGLRVKKSEASRIFQGVRIMHEIAADDEKTMHDELVDALVGQSHRQILILGSQRFGKADSDIQSALFAIQDLDQLDRMIAAILKVNSWQELLKTF